MTTARSHQDCNPNKQRQSNRKSILTEKFSSYKESFKTKRSVEPKRSIRSTYRVPKSARYAYIAQESADRKRRRHAQADRERQRHAQADNHITHN